MKRLYPLILGGLMAVHSVVSAQSSIDESLVNQTITVDPNGSGPNNYTSMSSAASFLNQTANKSGNFKVSIAAGTYREGDIYLNDRTGVTVIEGSAAGDVIFTGADIWTGWTHDGSGNYSKQWTNDWGLNPFDENYDEIQDDLGRRAEIVLLNGSRITQVADKASLVDDSYAVDETNDLLWIRLAGGADPDAGGNTVEVSTRNLSMFFFKSHNLVLRNLVYENYANSGQLENSYVVAIFGEADNLPTDQLLVENCEFRGNNASGMTINRLQNATFRNTKFHDNGITGVGPSRVRYLLVEDCEFSENNWRVGGYGLFTGWGPAGTKLLNFGDVVFRNCTFKDNIATGLWLDTGGENIKVLNCVSEGNAAAGIYIEASNGPFLVSQCVVRNNGYTNSRGLNQGGILVAESRNVTITDCDIEDNYHYQIGIRTRERNEIKGYYSGTTFEGFVEDVNVFRNRLKGKRITNPNEPNWYVNTHRDGGLVMMNTDSKTTPLVYRTEFLETLLSNNNSFYHEDRTTVFSNGGTSGFDREDLATWQTSGYNSDYDLDSNSQWEATDVWAEEFEAEDGNPQSPALAVTAPATSNGSYVDFPTGGVDHNPTTPHLSYTFNVRREQAYVVRMRVRTASGSDDSCYVKMNGGSWITWNGIASATTDWTWDSVRDQNNSFQTVKFVLNPGTHTLDIAMREDGFQVDEIQVSADETLVNAATLEIDSRIGPKLTMATLESVASDVWTSVTFEETYESPIVIATPFLPDSSSEPAVVRVRNVTRTGCDIMVASVHNSPTSYTRDVSLLVAEEGVYQEQTHGITMEAAMFNSTVTDAEPNYIGQAVAYTNTYTAPVVIGQVMTANDSRWSAFWSCGADYTQIADSTNLRIGKHVAEDPNNTRVNETLGYIVIESGSGFVGGLPYTAGITADSINGIDASQSLTGYSVPIDNVNFAKHASLGIAKMDGINGGFAVFMGDDPIKPDSLHVTVDEDTLGDSERKHTTEPFSYIVFGD